MALNISNDCASFHVNDIQAFIKLTYFLSHKAMILKIEE